MNVYVCVFEDDGWVGNTHQTSDRPNKNLVCMLNNYYCNKSAVDEFQFSSYSVNIIFIIYFNQSYLTS